MVQKVNVPLIIALLQQYEFPKDPSTAFHLAKIIDALVKHYTPQWWQKQKPEWREKLLQTLFHLDAGRGLALPFAATCLPDENHPEVLMALVSSWASGLAAGTAGGAGSQWLSFLRQYLLSENHKFNLYYIWRALDEIKSLEVSAEEWIAWLAELDQCSQFVGSTRNDNSSEMIREAVIWRVLLKMRCPTLPSGAEVSLGKRLASCVLAGENPYLLETLAVLPAMESDHQVWLTAWEQYSLKPEIGSLGWYYFWQAIVQAGRVGLYLPEETMETAIGALAAGTKVLELVKACHWVPAGLRVEKAWHDFWRPYLTSNDHHWRTCAWQAWRPESPCGSKLFRSPIMEQPAEFRLAAAEGLLTCHYPEMTREPWHSWWAEWVSHEPDANILSQLSWGMQKWQPLPEVILSAWRKRAHASEQDWMARLAAWQLLVTQPIDLTWDLICHLPCEGHPVIIKAMSEWVPRPGTSLPKSFWEQWGRKLTSSDTFHISSSVLEGLKKCCLEWHPVNQKETEAMWMMWKKVCMSSFGHRYRQNINKIMVSLLNAPFLADSPVPAELSALVEKEDFTFHDAFFLHRALRGGKDFVGYPMWCQRQVEIILSFIATLDKSSDLILAQTLDNLNWLGEQLSLTGQKMLSAGDGESFFAPMKNPNLSPQLQFRFFALCRKWGTPEMLRQWWEIASESQLSRSPVWRYSRLLWRVFLVETLSTALASCGEQADETTLRRLFRLMKQQWWRAEDVKLWQWLESMVNKAAAAGETSPFEWVGARERSGFNPPSVSSFRRTGWESWPDATSLDATSSNATSSGALRAHPFSPSLS
jgi:hypothetical protein